jgi:hypothetical protein
MLFVFLCFIAILVSVYLVNKTAHNYNTYLYKIESWNRDYKVYMNPSKCINCTVISIDILNICWSVAGIYINREYADSKAIQKGAIDACSKKHGLLITFSAYMFMFFGFFQIFRMAIYLCLVVFHREVLGTWEARARAHLNRTIKQPIYIFFETSVFKK